MKHNLTIIISAFILVVLLLWFTSCSKDCEGPDCDLAGPKPELPAIDGEAIRSAFGNQINPANLSNYAQQLIPDYINLDNGRANPITDAGATLGRVLFYDKKLSIDNTLACGGCHLQSHAFNDTAIVSKGVMGGVTKRHAMRLVNARFSAEEKFFWDERAATLEDQTTMPIKDHAELGYSGENGRPGFQDLIEKLDSVTYYGELFELAFGSPDITERKMQLAIAQFVRSIQSFDSKYDEGFKTGFSNYSESEKRGLVLFTTDPEIPNGQRIGGGVGCFNCHRPPAFDIKPNSGNNGNIRVANKPDEIDVENTRAPSLRDLANPQGVLNGPLMHDGSIHSFEELITAVGSQVADARNTNRDPIFGSGASNLNITDEERADLIAFLKTLSGHAVYTDPRWSNPFPN